MAEILEKMIQADVIFMATPVYFYTMDAQIKTLIDRTVARYTGIRNNLFKQQQIEVNKIQKKHLMDLNVLQTAYLVQMKKDLFMEQVLCKR